MPLCAGKGVRAPGHLLARTSGVGYVAGMVSIKSSREQTGQRLISASAVARRGTLQSLPQGGGLEGFGLPNAATCWN